MNYERLTEKSIGCFVYDLKDFHHKVGEVVDYDAFFAYSMAVKRLGELEDKIESGLLVELPCKVGDTVYQTDSAGERVYSSTVKNIIFDAQNITFDETAIGTSIFLTKEAAEARLKELQEGKK